MYSTLWAQDLKLSVYSTPSMGRSDFGTAVGILLPGGIGDIEVGGFFEKNGYLGEGSDDDVSSMIAKDYTGIYTTIYLVGNEKIGFGVNMRGGAFDAEKFLITFAAVAEYYINPHLAVAASARFIDELPRIEGRLSINLSGKRNRTKRQEKYASAWSQYKNHSYRRF
ncbi:hypothetical protein BFP72_04690 [Reichenbachiella sp. 5M10]|nr:hypothetical protein BFP72_04690 [Reichenbachiella sp. 5M10]